MFVRGMLERLANAKERRWWTPPAVHVADSLLDPKSYSPYLLMRTGYLLRYARWSLARARESSVSSDLPQKLTVVLLSYKRQANLHPILRELVKCSFIDRIILSNNNPEVRMEDWVGVQDERLTIINQARRTAPGIRFELARESTGRYFATIDDDIFLSAANVRTLFEHLVRDPRRVHGYRGERYLPNERPSFPFDLLEKVLGPRYDLCGWRPMLENHEGEVDVINCVYFFTREHLEELFRLGGQLGLNLHTLRNGEDILLSSSGEGRPRIHALPHRVLDCITDAKRGVATFTSDNFYPERTRLFVDLKAIKPWPGEPAPVPVKVKAS